MVQINKDQEPDLQQESNIDNNEQLVRRLICNLNNLQLKMHLACR